MPRRLIYPALAALLGFLCVLWRPIYDDPLELAAYDLRQRLTIREFSLPVVLASIDEASIEHLGPWPWPRGDAHGELLNFLFGNGAEAVFLDLLLEESREGDDYLAFASSLGYTVIGGQASQGFIMGTDPTTGEPKKYSLLLPPPVAEGLDEHAKVGLLNKFNDEDGKIRDVLLALAVDNSQWPERPWPSPGLYLYLHYLGVQPDEVEYSIDGLPLGSFLPNIKSQESGEVPAELKIRDKRIPCSASVDVRNRILAFTLEIPFSPAQTARSDRGPDVVSYYQLPEVEAEGRFFVIGENTQSETDVVVTPVGEMKGMEVHAQTFQALVDQRFLRRLEEPELLLAGLALLLALALGFASPGWGTLLRAILVATLYSGLCGVLFSSGWWLPLASPWLQIVLTFAFLVVFRLAVARRVFAEFAAPEAAAEMLVSATGDTLEAETVEATIIVSDIRGYTTLSETRTPVEMLELLNQYHTATVAIYKRYGGRALTYQGDAQLIVFGYPNRVQDPPGAATRAAVGLQEAVIELRRLWNVSDDTFSVGAAVCTGPMAIGRLGSAETQIQYTVIGDPVRRAHKIQSMSDTLDSPVLLDPESAQACRGVALESLGLIEVDGIDEPVELFRPC